MASQDDGTRAQAVKDALSFLEGSAGRSALIELSYGEWILSRFDMRIEEAAAEEGLLTVIGDVREVGDALLYSEVNLPLSQTGIYDFTLAAGELRLSSDDGMRLRITLL